VTSDQSTRAGYRPAVASGSPLATLLRGLGWVSLASLWSTGVLGAVVLDRVGGPLAMAARMYGTGETEPSTPLVATPWLAFGAGIALPLVPLARRRIRLASLACLALLAVEGWHFRVLYLATAPR
jgi:hypothetical protein